MGLNKPVNIPLAQDFGNGYNHSEKAPSVLAVENFVGLLSSSVNGDINSINTQIQNILAIIGGGSGEEDMETLFLLNGLDYAPLQLYYDSQAGGMKWREKTINKNSCIVDKTDQGGGTFQAFVAPSDGVYLFSINLHGYFTPPDGQEIPESDYSSKAPLYFRKCLDDYTNPTGMTSSLTYMEITPATWYITQGFGGTFEVTYTGTFVFAMKTGQTIVPKIDRAFDNFNKFYSGSGYCQFFGARLGSIPA